MPATEIAEIKTRLLGTDVEGPVDVEFESNLRKLFAFVETMNEPGRGAERELQVEFCKQLQHSLMLFKIKIAHAYKSRYRGNTGGQILIDITEEGIALLEANTDADRVPLLSARRGLTGIKSVNDALFAPVRVEHDILTP